MTITHPLLEAEEAKDELLANDGAPAALLGEGGPPVHDDIADNLETIPAADAFQDMFRQVARLCCVQVFLPLIAGKGDVVKLPSLLIALQSGGHTDEDFSLLEELRQLFAPTLRQNQAKGWATWPRLARKTALRFAPVVFLTIFARRKQGQRLLIRSTGFRNPPQSAAHIRAENPPFLCKLYLTY